MAYSDFDKLKAFFFELKNAKFRPEKMRSRFVMNGGWATVNKAECFDLLRKKIPDLRGKDDAFLIKYLSNPNNIKNRVLAGFVAGERIELEKSLTEKPVATEGIIYQQESSPTEQAAPVGTTTSTSAGGMPVGMPSAPSIPSVPRFPRVIVRDKDIPQVTKEEANSQKEMPEDQQVNIPNQSKTPAITSVSTRTLAETKQVESTVASPSSRRFNFPSFRSSFSSGFKKMQNLASPAGPFLKVNSGRIGNGLKNMFGRTANLGGRAGLTAINHGGNFLNNLSNARSRFSGNLASARSKLSFSSGGGKKVAIAFAGVFFLILFMGVLGGMSGTTPTGEAAPISPSNRTPGLDYAIPFRNTTVVVSNPEGIKAQVKNNWPDAQLQNWDTIVLQSIANGWNPAFVLALWIEETGAQGKTPYDDPLGCAPDPNKPNSDIDISLGCLFRSFPIAEYSNDKFADFMCMYSESKKAPCVFQTNPNFPKNIKYWYSQLVPSGSGALTPVFSVPPPPTDGNYARWVKTNFNIDVSALPVPYPQWAYEILSASTSKFQNLIRSKPTIVIPVSGGSHTSEDTVSIKTGYDSDFFKQIFIHELGHRIKGTAGTTSPACNGQTIEQIESEGYLTYYAEHATPAQVRTPACGNNDQITRSDEDFGESVSYYINNEMGELNYGSDCSTYNSVNPYARGDRPAHKAYIQCLLGP